MAHPTIYLDPETNRKVTAAAKREKRSMSAWARVANAVLVTQNTRKFKRVPGLEVQDWIKE